MDERAFNLILRAANTLEILLLSACNPAVVGEWFRLRPMRGIM